VATCPATITTPFLAGRGIIMRFHIIDVVATVSKFIIISRLRPALAAAVAMAALPDHLVAFTLALLVIA
jgi:hypothetical protein